MHAGGQRGRTEVLPLFVHQEDGASLRVASLFRKKKTVGEYAIESNVGALELPDKENGMEKKKARKRRKRGFPSIRPGSGRTVNREQNPE